jgi:hypothetical protein
LYESSASQVPLLRGRFIPPPLAAVWLKRTASNFSRYAATHPPEGKATHCILSRLRLLTNAVRCAPLTRSPLPCKQGRVIFCGSAAGPQLSMLLSNLSLSCSPLEKGRTKGAGWIDGICTNPPLRRYRFFEADSFPRLWPPFGLKEQRQTLAAARQPTHPKGKRLTAFSVACGSLRMQFAAHR